MGRLLIRSLFLLVVSVRGERQSCPVVWWNALKDIIVSLSLTFTSRTGPAELRWYHEARISSCSQELVATSTTILPRALSVFSFSKALGASSSLNLESMIGFTCPDFMRSPIAARSFVVRLAKKL